MGIGIECHVKLGLLKNKNVEAQKKHLIVTNGGEGEK